MGYSQPELSSWTNGQLITQEISHRRSIASYVTGLTLTGLTTIASGGTLAPLTLPIGVFKAYKIDSHKDKLDMVRRELSNRHLSPPEKRNRDVLVPVAIAFTAYVTTLGLADIIDLVPSDVQGHLNSEVESAAGVAEGSGGLDVVADKYEAFIIAEAAAPLSNAAMRPTLPPRNSQPSYNKEYQ
ncbi:hypothetical protein V5O48_018663 [Marasmius crinis-equi]|uniref:Uncharacterized protein n=1 Tax=Marasmius crinis-equi TaxID=585013 RepID=A0ABR3EKP9_9AGAR